MSVAVRKFRSAESDGELTLELSAPIYVPEDDAWICAVTLSGAESGVLHGYGVDSLAALIAALEVIRTHFRSTGGNWLWLSDVPGDLGMPAVFTGIDHRLTSVIETVVSAEIQRYYLYNAST
ncbi:MAG: hypothetical protein QUV05_07110 [Phycisphaerae bacterium]|nr:hypothetical protein [Phycisphaerae bacterium]